MAFCCCCYLPPFASISKNTAWFGLPRSPCVETSLLMNSNTIFLFLYCSICHSQCHARLKWKLSVRSSSPSGNASGFVQDNYVLIPLFGVLGSTTQWLFSSRHLGKQRNDAMILNWINILIMKVYENTWHVSLHPGARKQQKYGMKCR